MASEPRPWLERVNPLAKLLATLPIMVFLLLGRTRILPLAVIAISLVVLHSGARMTRERLLMLWAVMPVFVIAVALGFSLWLDAAGPLSGTALFGIGAWQVTLADVEEGLAFALRVAAVLVVACVPGFTSSPTDLVRALVQNARVPSRIGYTGLVSLRFVPRFRRELGSIQTAQRVRGVDHGRPPLAWGRAAVRSTVPLLAGAIRHAERVSMSMDARGFGASAQRTERRPVPFRPSDWVFVVLALLLSATLVVAVAVTPIGAL
ncbi:energy-coupling factor transporter transmembrane component T [Leucobacter sp. wl10]|uniref:energy-coupling factor transporter transmembrane component T n=1 Tax=Leucobacter sp. wl10 TaxID=2304677 RepID=UPI001F09D199|nr:energy-coupling factor transporter transmembrane component T [Leucobacter sp. wl10]